MLKGAGIWTYIVGSQLGEPRGRMRPIHGVPPCGGWSRRWPKDSTEGSSTKRKSADSTDVDMGSMYILSTASNMRQCLLLIINRSRPVVVYV